MLNKKIYPYAAQAAILTALIALLIVASFFDLQINQKLYGANVFAKIGAVIGKAPAYLIAAFAGTVLFKSAAEREKRYISRSVLMAIYALVVVGASVMFGLSVVEDVIESKSTLVVITLILGALASATFFACSKALSMETVNRLKKWAFAAIVCVAAIVIVTAILKISWGRARYINIIEGEGVFTPWYIPNGNTGFKSLPSGHVALSTAIFLLIPMFKALPGMQSVEYGFMAFAPVYVLFIALSRIMGGFHFLSDVTVAMLIGFIVISIVNYAAFGFNFNDFLLKEKNVLNKL